MTGTEVLAVFILLAGFAFAVKVILSHKYRHGGSTRQPMPPRSGGSSNESGAGSGFSL